MMGPVSTSKSWVTWAQFLTLALAWGASFLFIKIGLRGLSPAQVVLGRLAFGAVALLAVSGVTRTPLPRFGAVWGHLAVVAVLLCVAPFLLFSWAEQTVPSSLASIFNAATPLMTTLASVAVLPEERPTRSRLLGLLAGFGGVVLVLGPWRQAGGGGVLGQAACLGATACYGLGFVYLRRFVAPRGLPSVSVATLQVALGTVIMLVLSPAIATGPVRLSGAVVASIAALGMAGTGIAYVWNTNVVSAWGAANASAVTYLTPLVGVVLGVLVLSERLHWNEPAGAVLVVLGIAVSQGRIRLLPEPRPERQRG